MCHIPESGGIYSSPTISTIDEPKKVVTQTHILNHENSPPYEDPLDLTVGLHFQDQSLYTTFEPHMTNLPADFELARRFQDMCLSPEGGKLRAMLTLDVVNRYPRFTDPTKVFRVGVFEPDDWVQIHEHVLKLREKWFPDVYLPIRYFEYVEDEDF